MKTLHHLLPESTIRLLTHFLIHRDGRLHLRALRERLGIGMGALQRELARLEAMGLVERTERDGKVYYRPTDDEQSWDALYTLVGLHVDPAHVIREVLSNLDGIKVAFIFGSTVRGDTRPDSDVDLFVVEEGIPPGEMGGAMLDAQRLLGREVDVKRYTPEALARKSRTDRGFLPEALSGPKVWVVGSDEVLRKLREAA